VRADLGALKPALPRTNSVGAARKLACDDFDANVRPPMAVDFKDYYKTLGISRDATADEIKKAFRKLARLHHPDVAKDKKKSEAKFKEINEAHEVLSDPDKRKKYDELGANWRQGEPGQPRRSGGAGWNSGGGVDEEVHFGGTGFSDFFEQFFSRGRRTGNFDEMFRRSGGRGAAHEPQPGTEIEGDILVTLHEAMHGSMRTISLQRADPQTGNVEKETFTVRIPPGAQEGRRIRVPGKGGAGVAGGAAGDLFLRVRLAADPNFTVQGTDLYHELMLAPWEAALGAQVAVPTLSGTLKLKIPPGTNTGRQLRVRGQGLPKGPGGERGDLYAVISVQVPERLTDDERKAWENLVRVSRFNPRDNDTDTET
jgi:curved DNA-binding protein